MVPRKKVSDAGSTSLHFIALHLHLHLHCNGHLHSAKLTVVSICPLVFARLRCRWPFILTRLCRAQPDLESSQGRQRSYRSLLAASSLGIMTWARILMCGLALMALGGQVSAAGECCCRASWKQYFAKDLASIQPSSSSSSSPVAYPLHRLRSAATTTVVRLQKPRAGCQGEVQLALSLSQGAVACGHLGRRFSHSTLSLRVFLPQT